MIIGIIGFVMLCITVAMFLTTFFIENGTLEKVMMGFAVGGMILGFFDPAGFHAAYVALMTWGA